MKPRAGGIGQVTDRARSPVPLRDHSWRAHSDSLELLHGGQGEDNGVPSLAHLNGLLPEEFPVRFGRRVRTSVRGGYAVHF